MWAAVEGTPGISRGTIQRFSSVASRWRAAMNVTLSPVDPVYSLTSRTETRGPGGSVREFIVYAVTVSRLFAWNQAQQTLTIIAVAPAGQIFRGVMLPPASDLASARDCSAVGACLLTRRRGRG